MRQILKVIKLFVFVAGGVVFALKLIEKLALEKATDKVQYGVRIIPDEGNSDRKASKTNAEIIEEVNGEEVERIKSELAEYNPDELVEIELDTSEEDELIEELESMNEEEREEFISEISEDIYRPEVDLTQFTKRQRRIFKLFDKSEKVDSALLGSKIPDVSLRTLRRDLEKLEDAGLVAKIGKTKGSYYVRI